MSLQNLFLYLNNKDNWVSTKYPRLLSKNGWDRYFQEPHSPVAEGIFLFHNDLRVILIGILIFVRYILYICLSKFKQYKTNNNRLYSAQLTHFAGLEIVWTIRPALILGVIAIPSFALLYSIDEIIEPLRTIKVIGHQWYWSYEYLNPIALTEFYNNNNILIEGLETETTFDSYLTDNSNKRLLIVDRHLILPIKRHIRAIITSADVLHSWAIPSLGVKLDACPGRLNQTSFYINHRGTYYGQCSEICGQNHGFRPIGIIAKDFMGDIKGKTPLEVESIILSIILSI